MTSLKKAWEKIKFEFDARDIFSPPHKVKKELEKQGWSFKTFTTPPRVRGHFGVISSSVTITYTPEGTPAYESQADRKRYKKARRTAATKIYKPLSNQ